MTRQPGSHIEQHAATRQLAGPVPALHVARHVSGSDRIVTGALMASVAGGWMVLMVALASPLDERGRYGRLGYGVSVLFVFVTGLHTSLSDALLTCAPSVWYPTYIDRAAQRGGKALDDQQLAGMLMWIPARTLFLVIGIALSAAWMAQSERRARHARWNVLHEKL